MSLRISIVDYGIGNVGSVVNMLRHIGADAELVDDAAGIAGARALLLPGVGHFGHAMKTLHERDLVRPLQDKVSGDGVPILGICLGMQLLGRGSEEGDAEGLGFIDAEFRRIEPPAGSGLKVPHMGWNILDVKRANPLLPTEGEQRFYFVHSYRANCSSPEQIIATCTYGSEFCCVYGADRVLGTQFHPEKSHRFGMNLLSRFVEFAC